MTDPLHYARQVKAFHCWDMEQEPLRREKEVAYWNRFVKTIGDFLIDTGGYVADADLPKGLTVPPRRR